MHMNPGDSNPGSPTPAPPDRTPSHCAEGEEEFGQRERDELTSRVTPTDTRPEIIEQPDTPDVEVVAQEALDFTDGAMTTIIADYLPIVAWPDAVLKAVLHSGDFASGSSIQIVARAAFRDTGSQQTYVADGDLTSIEFNSSSIVDAPKIQPLPPATRGSGVRIEVRGTPGGTPPTCVASISVTVLFRVVAAVPSTTSATPSAYDGGGMT